MLVIDATNLILGRLASFAAKKALEGEEIVIVNSEKAVISGKKDSIFEFYKQRRARGNPLKGPYYPRMPDRILRRAIRGMLPWHKPRGREAFKRVMCYIGIPEKYKNQEFISIKEADYSKLKKTGFITLGKLAEMLGAKVRW